MTARASGEIAPAVGPSADTGAAAPPPEGAAPKAPKKTFAPERFIALPIISVSRVPEAPTSVPPMMRALLPRTKPAEAAARPVKAFRDVMTTGMSGPAAGRGRRPPQAGAG